MARSTFGRCETVAMFWSWSTITGAAARFIRIACSVNRKWNLRDSSLRASCASRRARTARSMSRAGLPSMTGVRVARAYSAVWRRPDGMIGRKCRTVLDDSHRALISACRLQIPVRADERTETYSTFAARVAARISLCASDGTSSAVMMRSTSATVGRTFPDSIRLILDWDIAARAASLSPESPAALRSRLSVSARSLRSRFSLSGSSIELAERHSVC